MTEPIHVRRFIIGASPDEVIDWDNDPRVQCRPIPRVSYEYGASDPDDHSRIHVHRDLEMAREAAEWWGIDRKVFRREVTEWEVLNG